jgi:hypothetical protein
MNKLKIVSVCLLALFIGMVSVGSPVSCSTSVLYDDGSSFWAAGANTVISTETVFAYYGTCAKFVVSGGIGSFSHTYSGNQNWASYDAIAFYYYGANSGQTIYFVIEAPSWAHRFEYIFIDNFIGWQLKTIDFDSFIITSGSPSWTTVVTPYLTNITNGVTGYIDRMWLLHNNTQSIVITDPIYATITPIVGTHVYVEDQPVQISATMLLDYTFLKFSYSPVGVSTSNPMWLVMTENMTLNTIIVPPTAIDYTTINITTILAFITIVTLLGLSLICYKLKLRLFCMIIAIIGITINVLSFSMNIPFTPYIQLLFMLIEMVAFIYSVKGVRN